MYLRALDFNLTRVRTCIRTFLGSKYLVECEPAIQLSRANIFSLSSATSARPSFSPRNPFKKTYPLLADAALQRLRSDDEQDPRSKRGAKFARTSCHTQANFPSSKPRISLTGFASCIFIRPRGPTWQSRGVIPPIISPSARANSSMLCAWRSHEAGFKRWYLLTGDTWSGTDLEGRLNSTPQR